MEYSMFDAARFCDDYSIDYIERGKNVGYNHIGVLCPFCNDDGYHGSFNLGSGHWYCWRCGGRSTYTIVKELLGVSPKEVFDIMDAYSIRTQIRESLNVPRPTKLDIPGGPLTSIHRKYLRERGFDPAEIEQTYKVRGTGITGEWAYRIVVPVFYKGEAVSFVARDVTNRQDLRYKNCTLNKSIMDPKTVLYNTDNCADSTVVVVEGIFDCWKVGKNCCATLGTSTTDAQVRMLSKFKKVIISFDNEGPAQKRAFTFGEKVSMFGPEVVIFNHEWKHDLGAASQQEVDWFRKEVFG